MVPSAVRHPGPGGLFWGRGVARANSRSHTSPTTTHLKRRTGSASVASCVCDAVADSSEHYAGGVVEVELFVCVHRDAAERAVSADRMR